MSYVFEALQRAQRQSGKAERPWGHGPAADTQEDQTPGTSAVSLTALKANGLSIRARPEDRLVTITDPQGAGAEKFRVLASRIRLAQKRAGFRRLLITSSTVADGKSLVTANLGLSMASYAGFRVLLIDSDSRHARLSALLGCQTAPGLKEWLAERGPVERYLRRYSDTLCFMPAGTKPSSSHPQFEVDYLAKALASIGNLFDLVIIDSPPVTMLAEATLWLGVTDACLLIVRRGQTPKRMLQKALAAVEPSRLLGIVLNEFADSTRSYYEHYYSAAALQREHD